MKVLVYFPWKKQSSFFEGAMLENKIKRACKSVTILSEFSRDADIANFINLRKKSVKVINQAVKYSIPTLLWMFFTNNDENARVIEVRKDGTMYIPTARLEIINMMDGVVVPTNEAKAILWKLGIKIPVFVVHGAVNIKRIEEIKNSRSDIFRRYFRIDETEKYTISVLNIKARQELTQLNLLAAAVPHFTFYAFISASNSLVDTIRLKRHNKITERNLIVTKLIPEDVYRAGLLDASYFIDLGVEKVNIMTLYEPMHVKLPIIVQKRAIFKEIISDDSAFVVNDFSGAAYVMRNEVDASEKIKNAFNYTTKVNEQSFIEAIFNLFKKIYTR